MEIKQKAVSISEKIIYWSIIMVPFVASFSSAAVQIFIGFMIFFFLVKKILTKDLSIAKTPINLPFALMIAVALVSFVNSVKIHSSIQCLG